MRHVARKRFGQNFLIDEAVIAAIIEALAPQPDDLVVEIGPGLGALTHPLAGRLDHLHVVELDRDIVTRLHAEFAPDRVTVHAGDALQFDFGQLGSNLRVIGNLPYNISTPLLFHLARHAGTIRDLHVMLQKEVVDRMVAAPHSPEYSRLSVMLQYRFEMEKVLDVSPQAFQPAPKVDSAVVRMMPHARLPYPASDEARFSAIVAAAFSQRRKTLRNALKGYFGATDFARLGVDGGLRAQDLGVAEFVLLANDSAA